MASVGAVQLPDFSKSNALFDPQAIAQDAARTNALQNVAASGTQDLADRATLRSVAAGLTARDPGALGTAVSLGASGQGAAGTLSTMDTQTAASKLAIMQYSAGLPQWGGSGSAQQASPNGDGAPPGLEQSESGGKPGAVNSQGYSGLFQFGTGRLTDLGMYQPAKGENPNGNQWKGQFTIPGHPEVQTYQQFLNSSDAQRAAMAVHVGDIHQAIYETPGADKFNMDGLTAVAHLGGIGGMQKFVATNGAYNPGDAPNSSSGGTHLADYYNRYSQGGRTQLAADHGHPMGPLPSVQQAQQGALPVEQLPGMQGGMQRAPLVQLASANGTTGMPQSMTDAGGAESADASLPIPPRGGPPSQPGGMATAAAPAGMTSEQAVQQAQQEMAGRQAGMDPVTANQQVVQRAQQILTGGGGAGQPAAAQGPQAGSAAAGPPPSTMSQGLQRRPLAAPSGQAMNALYSPAMASAAPMQPNSLAMVQAPAPGDVPQPGAQNPPAAVAPPAAAPAAPAAQPMPQLVTTGTGAIYTQGLPAGYGYEQGTHRIVPLPGTQKLEIKDAGPLRSFIDPHTGQTVRTEAIPDHSRPVFRDVQGGTQQYQSGQPVGPIIPYSGRPEQDSAYKADIDRTGAITQSVQAAQASAPRLNEMADLAQQLTTSGPGGPAFARAATYLESAGVSPDTIKQFTGMSGGAAAQMFVKLNVQAAGADAKANVGANTGIGSINLYQTANPGLALLPDANKRITNMMRVANQATQDYGQGALQHFGQNEQQFLGGGQYAPLTSFNNSWQSQNNPQVYAAATGILNGDSFDKWRARLSSPDEGFRAAQITARIDPNVMVPGRNGGGIPARQFLQAQGR